MDPKYFRRLTDEASKSHKSREDTARESRIQKRVNDSVAVAPRLAEDAAKEGKNKACVFEFETGVETKEFDQVQEETQEVVRRITEHFKNKGFTVALEGPGIDGGPSHVYYWWGISISW